MAMVGSPGPSVYLSGLHPAPQEGEGVAIPHGVRTVQGRRREGQRRQTSPDHRHHVPHPDLVRKRSYKVRTLKPLTPALSQSKERSKEDFSRVT